MQNKKISPIRAAHAIEAGCIEFTALFRSTGEGLFFKLYGAESAPDEEIARLLEMAAEEIRRASRRGG